MIIPINSILCDFNFYSNIISQINHQARSVSEYLFEYRNVTLISIDYNINIDWIYSEIIRALSWNNYKTIES